MSEAVYHSSYPELPREGAAPESPVDIEKSDQSVDAASNEKERQPISPNEECKSPPTPGAFKVCSFVPFPQILLYDSCRLDYSRS
jgi:hypothetical protein